MPEVASTSLPQQIPVLHILSPGRGLEVDHGINVRNASTKLGNTTGRLISEGAPTGLISAQPDIIGGHRRYEPFGAITKSYFTSLAVNYKMSIAVARGQEIIHFVPADPDLLDLSLRISDRGHGVLALLLRNPSQLFVSRHGWLPNFELQVAQDGHPR